MAFEGAAKMIGSGKATLLGDGGYLHSSVGKKLFCFVQAKIDDKLLWSGLKVSCEELSKIDFAYVTELGKSLVA